MYIIFFDSTTDWTCDVPRLPVIKLHVDLVGLFAKYGRPQVYSPRGSRVSYQKELKNHTSQFIFMNSKKQHTVFGGLPMAFSYHNWLLCQGMRSRMNCLGGFLIFTNDARTLLYARRDGVEVEEWTVDRRVRIRFPVYLFRVWALWWQGGKRCLRTSRCPCRGRLDTLKTPSCPWRWVTGSRSKFGNWTTVPSLYTL